MKLATNFEMGYSLCQFEDTISEFYLDLKFKVTHDQLTKHNFRVTVTSTKPIEITHTQYIFTQTVLLWSSEQMNWLMSPQSEHYFQ